MSNKPPHHTSRTSGPFVEQSPQHADASHHTPLEQTVELQLDANHPLQRHRNAHASQPVRAGEEPTMLLSRPDLSSPSSEALPAASTQPTPNNTKPHPLSHRIQPPRHASPFSDALPAQNTTSAHKPTSAPAKLQPPSSSTLAPSPMSKREKISSFFSRKDGPMEMYMLVGGIGILLVLVFVWAFFIFVSLRSPTPKKSVEPRQTPTQQQNPPAKLQPQK